MPLDQDNVLSYLASKQDSLAFDKILKHETAMTQVAHLAAFARADGMRLGTLERAVLSMGAEALLPL